MLPQHKALLRAAVPFIFFLLLLAGCGQSPQTASSTPVETSTSGEQNLQATVNTLQTQLAIQSTLVPTTVPTEIPAATTAPTTIASEVPTETTNPIVGKWAFSISTLEGTPEPRDSSDPTEIIEFLSDNRAEITIIGDNGKIDKYKGTYTLSN